jgi:hypothetical protein
MEAVRTSETSDCFNETTLRILMMGGSAHLWNVGLLQRNYSQDPDDGRQCAPLKRRYTSTRPRSCLSQKALCNVRARWLENLKFRKYATCLNRRFKLQNVNLENWRFCSPEPVQAVSSKCWQDSASNVLHWSRCTGTWGAVEPQPATSLSSVR